MAKVQFIGRAIPTVFHIQTAPQNVTWNNSTDRSVTFDVRVANSLINVRVDCPDYTSNDLSELYKHAYDLSRAAINLVAFAAGMGVIVVFDTFIDPDGNPTLLQMQDQELAPYCTVFKLRDPATKQFDDLFRIVATDPILIRLMGDLIETVWNPHVCPVNCGRVIDGIRRLITPVGSATDAQAWKAMHSLLNISQGYQQYISTTATGPRHADPAFVNGQVTHDIAKRTWQIMNRFLSYRVGGNVQLDTTEFPLLT